MKTEKLKLIHIKQDKVVERLDVAGKWPTQTWLQQRRAVIKLAEAKRELDNGRE